MYIRLALHEMHGTHSVISTSRPMPLITLQHACIHPATSSHANTPADMTQLTSRGEDRGEDFKVLIAVHVDALHLDGFDTGTHKVERSCCGCCTRSVLP